jgi:hypothetical protein
MQAAAFWKGDIIKRDVDYIDFFTGGVGSVHNKMTQKERNMLQQNINQLHANKTWLTFADKTIHMTEDNYHTNFHKIKNGLINLDFGTERRNRIKERIIKLMSTYAPLSSKPTIDRTITATTNPRNLNELERLNYIIANLNGFINLAQKTSHTSSGTKIYGEGIDKYIARLFDNMVLLHKIKDKYITNTSRYTDEHDELYTQIREILDRDIAIQDINEDDVIIRNTMSVWDALIRIGKLYGRLNVGNRADIKNIQSNIMGMRNRTKKDRENLEWIETIPDEEYLSEHNISEIIYDILHLYHQYEDLMNSRASIGNREFINKWNILQAELNQYSEFGDLSEAFEERIGREVTAESIEENLPNRADIDITRE